KAKSCLRLVPSAAAKRPPRELINFNAMVTAAISLAVEAWREGEHDDLILACASAAWEAERARGFNIRWAVIETNTWRPGGRWGAAGGGRRLRSRHFGPGRRRGTRAWLDRATRRVGAVGQAPAAERATVGRADRVTSAVRVERHFARRPHLARHRSL